ncbi:cell division/GTP binding protein [Lichtheimia hyalospora FSU 10163]|nr:cell division/GTP binding protein [Lichtheimia hyalospora FSU 10163]
MLYRGHPLCAHHSRSQKNAKKLNLIVMGQTSSGKTTFVRTMCEYLGSSVIQGTLKESTPMVLKDTLEPTQATYSVSMEIEQDDNERISLTLTDTPGISSNLSLLEYQQRYLCMYIDHQYERTFLEVETNIKRSGHVADTHIHACLFFVDGDKLRQSGRLSDVDRYMIRMLASRVNVIPVVGKGDTMAALERQRLKICCRNDIFDVFQLPVYGYEEMAMPESQMQEWMQFNNDSSSSSDSEKRGSGSHMLDSILDMLEAYVEEDEEDEEAYCMKEYLRLIPFTVIGFEQDPNSGEPLSHHKEKQKRPKKKKPRDDKPFLGRYYPWGVVDCCNPEYSDFVQLVTMLLSSHCDMLRSETFERFYERYRINRLMKTRVDKTMALERTVRHNHVL